MFSFHKLRKDFEWLIDLMPITRIKKIDPSVVFDAYEDAIPTQQNLVNLFSSWNHALPPNVGAIAGPHTFYTDPRIYWALDMFGSIENRTVLELGPLEASHTFLLSQHSPSRIVAIEANRLALLKCLIVKEILKFKNVEFLLGDCQKWFDHFDERFDLIIACGILYHMRDPVKLLESISAHTDSVMIWTHYFDDEHMPLGDPRRIPFSGEVRLRPFRDFSIRLHKRSYLDAQIDQKFCGGIEDQHYWLERQQIIDILTICGFDNISIGHEEPDHIYGPAFSIFARRTSIE